MLLHLTYVRTLHSAKAYVGVELVLRFSQTQTW